MTVSSSTSKNQYVSTGGTGYDYTFKIFRNSDLKVIRTDPATKAETELTLESDYTVSGAGDASGGRVSLAAAPTTGHTVTILRRASYTQEVDLVDNDPFHADTMEEALDKLTMLAQQLLEITGRTVRLAESSTTPAAKVVLPEPNPGKAIGWDASSALGNMSDMTGTVVSSFMETVLDDATAADARATLQAAADDHHATHVRGATDVIDGDRIEISYSPAGYTPATAPAEVDHADELTAHLAGIDAFFAGALRSAERQSVLSGTVDSNGFADFLSSAGSDLVVEASAVPLDLSFAAGFNGNGAVDRYARVSADVTISSAETIDGAVNFIYADHNDGSPIFGVTPYPPLYGFAAPTDGIGQGAVLADFNGADAATGFTGAYGESWTLGGNAQLDDAQKKFGSTSLKLPAAGASGDHAQIALAPFARWDSWAIETWVRIDSWAAAGIQSVFSTPGERYCLWLATASADDSFRLYLSSDGASDNIASNVSTSTTGFSDDTWYHLALVRTGTHYKLYVDGAEEISIASTADLAWTDATALRVGGRYDGVDCLGGWIDDFRISPYARYTAAFTAPTGAFAVEDLHYFNVPEMKMYGGWPGNWAAATTLFLGEAGVGADGNIDTVAAYALRGRYDSGWFSIAVGNHYVKAHNLGLDDYVSRVYLRESDRYVPQLWDYEQTTSHYGGILGQTGRLTAKYSTAGNYVNLPLSTYVNAFSSAAETTGEARMIVERGWS